MTSIIFVVLVGLARMKNTVNNLLKERQEAEIAPEDKVFVGGYGILRTQTLNYLAVSIMGTTNPTQSGVPVLVVAKIQKISLIHYLMTPCIPCLMSHQRITQYNSVNLHRN